MTAVLAHLEDRHPALNLREMLMQPDRSLGMLLAQMSQVCLCGRVFTNCLWSVYRCLSGLSLRPVSNALDLDSACLLGYVPPFRLTPLVARRCSTTSLTHPAVSWLSQASPNNSRSTRAC